jgi:hypothetical protein
MSATLKKKKELMMSWELIKSNAHIIDHTDNNLGNPNKTQVNYNSKMDYLPLSFHIKDKEGILIAGINSFTCWQMLYTQDPSKC